MDRQNATITQREVHKITPPPIARPLISPKDIYEVPRLGFQAVLAWFLPEAAWGPLSQLFGRVNVFFHPKRTAAEVSAIAPTVRGTAAQDTARRIAVENWANRFEERFQYMRAWRPGGWEPSIEISGAKYVSSALNRGRGIILWAGNFSFKDLVAKIAWCRLGLAVTHFSRPIHGFSSTEFGVRYLNAVRRGIEDRYLGERLMVEEHETGAALKKLRERLADNGTISFTVGNQGQRTATAQFLGRRLTIATGPLAIAQATGAALMPVHTLRQGPGRFEVIIEAPIELKTGGDGQYDYAAAVQRYADMLAPVVLRDPGQWRGWRYTTPN
jgi:KDO2-lipid IV(A) lauroyltransferase